MTVIVSLSSKIFTTLFLHFVLGFSYDQEVRRFFNSLLGVWKFGQTFCWTLGLNFNIKVNLLSSTTS